jgi:hypothetical protein
MGSIARHQKTETVFSGSITPATKCGDIPAESSRTEARSPGIQHTGNRTGDASGPVAGSGSFQGRQDSEGTKFMTGPSASRGLAAWRRSVAAVLVKDKPFEFE